MDLKEENLVSRCTSIEKKLSKLYLWANLVPKNSFFDNLRYLFSNEEWDIIRKLVYKRDKYKCKICKRDNIKLEAHEEWVYNYKEETQKLSNIISLCNLCHVNKHLGFAEILIEEKKLAKENIIKHWCWVNHEKEENFNSYRESIFELWNLKNMIKWKIISFDENLISYKIDLSKLLRFLATRLVTTKEI